MIDKKAHPTPSVANEALALRARAEARFNQTAANPAVTGEPLRPEVASLLHELQVHQIQLEMQNEELRRTQTALDTSQAKYFDFYDLAPVGYCSINDKGLISQANLSTTKLLRVARNTLLNRVFGHFVQHEDQDRFYLFRQRLLDSGQPLLIELSMVKADGTPFWAELAALAVPEPDGGQALRLVLSDISDRKAAQEKLVLAASVFSHSGEGIVITDADANITEVNDTFSPHISR